MEVHADTRAVVSTYALKGNTVYVKPYM